VEVGVEVVVEVVDVDPDRCHKAGVRVVILNRNRQDNTAYLMRLPR